MPLNCGGYLEDTLVNRKMTQMFSYRKSSCLHGPRHGVNIQCTMTAWRCMMYETWIWAQICAPPDQLQERHVRPFLTTALWSQLQAASEAPFGLCLTFMTFKFCPFFFPSSAAKWSLEGMCCLMTTHLPNPEAKIHLLIAYWLLTYWNKRPTFAHHIDYEMNIHITYYEFNLDWHFHVALPCPGRWETPTMAERITGQWILLIGCTMYAGQCQDLSVLWLFDRWCVLPSGNVALRCCFS